MPDHCKWLYKADLHVRHSDVILAPLVNTFNEPPHFNHRYLAICCLNA